jgi:glycosyltransferase involved in cell wall biosynthesis
MIDGKVSILIVDTAIDFGGSIVSTANLIRGLDRSRYEPIFVSATSEELVRNKLAEASAETKVLIIKKAMHYGRLASIANVLKKIKPRFLQKALIYSLYLLRLVINVPYAFRMARVISKYRVDLVQLNNAFGNDELELVSMLMQRPRVVFFRGYIPLSAIERKFFLTGVKAFVSVSEFVKQEAIADGVPAEKIRVATPPAIPEPLDDETRNAVRKRYSLRPDELVFGIFGRVVNWKGQKEFILAAAPVLKALPNCRAFVVGDTSDGDVAYLHDVKRIAKEHGIEDRVIFTGYIEKVYELYGIMDVVVHASIHPEPSGRVIFESMSCGTPVIASCYGGPKEFIEDGVDGYICDPKAPEQISVRLESLLSNPVLRKEVGLKAQDKISRLHNKKAYASSVERVYVDSIQIGPLGVTGEA